MRRFLRVAAVVVVAGFLVAACGSTPQSQKPAGSTGRPASVPAPMPSGEPASAPAPVSTPTAGPTGSATNPAPPTIYRCDTSDLSAGLGEALGAGGQSSRYFLLTNVSDHPCGLIGYPGLQMLDANGAALATQVSRWGTKWPTVILQPGGVASFEVIWQNGFGYATPPPSCAFPARIEVTPPNAYTSLAVAVQGIEVCSNGLLEVTSVVAGTNPEVYLPG